MEWKDRHDLSLDTLCEIAIDKIKEVRRKEKIGVKEEKIKCTLLMMDEKLS
ncbi:hypothetical protein G7050_07800 [Dysgonomonas sp. HDW5A]|uniref:hypothetical protein n=1 Tax=Dysgonomonas sp. HDW5A TaxID=2714926 RepID=UPI00140E4FFD|nr:hypothetical protein [Dysgonomonas sp. HDW5A]QIK59740.1 hypothetical protein G7050_07800 [Dysgonomonas sp. HDW5A]